MNGVVTGGLFPRGEGRSFSAHRAGPVKCKQSRSSRMESACPGMEDSQPTRSHQLTMTGNRFSLVSGVADIMIASTWRMLSDMKRKGDDG